MKTPNPPAKVDSGFSYLRIKEQLGQ
jgi:hypothetical protein